MFIKIKILTFSTNSFKLCRIMKVTKGPKSSRSKTDNSSSRAKPKSTPNTSKKMIRANSYKTASSTTPSKSSTAISPSSSCKTTSTDSENSVPVLERRWGKILRCQNNRCTFGKRAENDPFPERTRGGENSLRERYLSCISQTHERQL